MVVDGFIEVCSSFFFFLFEWMTKDETNVL